MLFAVDPQKKQISGPVLVLSLLTLALFFSGFLVFLTPLPIIYLCLKARDYRQAIVPALILFAVVFLFYNLSAEYVHGLYREHPSLIWLLPVPNVSLLEYFPRHIVIFFGAGYFAYHVISGILIGRVLNSPEKLFLQVFVIVAALLVVVGVVFYGVLGVDGMEFFATYRTYMEKGILELLTLQENAGGDVSALLDLKNQLPELVDYTVYLLPSFIMSSLTILFAINLVVAKRLFSPVFKGLVKVDLSRFQVPFALVWLVIFLVAALLFNVKILDNRVLHFLVLNILVVVAEIYFFQGFAVLMWFLEKKQVYGLWRLTFYLSLILFLQPVVVLLSLLGFFENWLDVRKLDAGTPGGGEPQKKT